MLLKDDILAAKRMAYDRWLEAAPAVASIIGKPWSEARYTWLDLSRGGRQIRSGDDLDQAAAFDAEIQQLLTVQGAEYGLGGYNEERAFYITPAYRTPDGRYRSVHIGLDVWTNAGHPIHTPLDGRVHSLRHNDAPRDYGPTLLLEHTVSAQLTFWTLYGHLDPEVLDHWQPGAEIRAGAPIATIGKLSDNGHWPPHLHFQVILDRMGQMGDFPGVAFPEERDRWLTICPDPTPLTGLMPSEKL